MYKYKYIYKPIYKPIYTYKIKRTTAPDFQAMCAGKRRQP